MAHNANGRLVALERHLAPAPASLPFVSVDTIEDAYHLMETIKPAGKIYVGWSPDCWDVDDEKQHRRPPGQT